MKQTPLAQLFESLDELERALRLTREHVTSFDPVPMAILRRVAEYETILRKQRMLARELCRYILSQNWDEVARHIKLINGLSEMVCGDIQHMVEQYLPQETFKDPVYLPTS